MLFYLDTSAFLKLVRAEPESVALRAWLETEECNLCSSQLLLTEAVRAAELLGVERRVVDEALDAVSLVLPAAPTFLRAANLRPARVRTLDALHLAAALELGDELHGIVTYDRRMVDGAMACGLAPISPGAAQAGPAK